MLTVSQWSIMRILSSASCNRRRCRFAGHKAVEYDFKTQPAQTTRDRVSPIMTPLGFSELNAM